MKCIQGDLDARNEHANSNKLILKYVEDIWNTLKSVKKHFWCCNPTEQNGYDQHIKRA